MKQCTYCGKQYPDDTGHCLVDGEPLIGTEPQPPPARQEPSDPSSASSLSSSDIASEAPGFPLPDRKLRIIELVLVCVIAFGSSILVSTFIFLGYRYGNSGNGFVRWSN